MFEIFSNSINNYHSECRSVSSKSGAEVVFRGIVRNHNDGKSVINLEYECYKEMALKEGTKIIEEAKRKFPIHQIWAVHRIGLLNIGDVAVIVGCDSVHRLDSFKAASWSMDQIKFRVPIWKKEKYADGVSKWIICSHNHKINSALSL